MQLNRKSSRRGEAKNVLVPTENATARNVFAGTAPVEEPLPSPAIVARPGPDGGETNLWFTVAETPWRRLAVVSADGEVKVHALCERIACAARANGCVDVAVSREGASPGEAAGRALIPVANPAKDPGARAALAGADAVLVCIRFGETRMSAVEQVLAWCEHKKVLGAFSVAAPR